MRNSFKKLLAAAIATLTLSVGYSRAQELRTITGVVLDETDLGIPGAYVVVKNQTRGSITDVEGKFTLEVKKGDILQVTFLGYQDEEISVGDQKHIIIKMTPSSDMLDEVTFVAYGSQRKASVIGSISTIKADALASPAGQLSSGLAGKLAGIVSLQRTGEPGAGSDFWIRGVNTFGANSKPLILVDGIERDMDLVDTEDIASFSILKDATATALYGVRGANGIVLITTKRGQESKPQVNFKYEHGLTQPVKLPKLANTEQWIDYYNELYVDAGSKPVIDEYEREMYLSGADPDLYPSVDWVSTVFKDMANTERLNVSVTGGTKSVRYYVGASYYMEDGIFNVVKDSDYSQYDNQIRYDKFNFRSNVDIDITKSTTLALSLSTQYYTKTTPGHSLADIYAYTMYSTPIASPPVFSDGTLANPEGGYNPYRMINSSGYKRNTNIVAQSLISLTQDFSDIITKGLKANVKFSWDADNGNVLGRLLNPTLYYTNGRDEDGNLIYEPWNEGTNYMYLSRTNSSYTTTNFEASVNYEREFAYAHNVSALLLFSARSKYNNVPATFEQSFAYKNMGLAGRATYSYKDRYFGEFNFGYNGSENFAPGNRFGFFPSVAVGYMISNEPFWDPIKDTINLLKFKVSYGKIGNDQIGGSRRFAYNSTVNTSAPGFTFGTNPIAIGGITTGEVGNSDVKWEEALKFNAGLEITLFRDLQFQIDYFSDHRSGIFIERQSTPPIVGLNKQQWVNLGEMENKGVDMSLQYDHTFGDLYVSARANYTFNRNKKLYDDMPDQIWSYQNLTGFAYNQQFGLIAEGLFVDQDDIDNWPKQEFGNVRPGDIKYRDVNGDGVVNTFDKVAIGYTTIPEINYGFGVSLGYKGFDLSVFFQGVSHVTRIIGGQNLFGASSQIHKLGQIFEDVALNRWTLSNQDPNAPYPRLSLNKVENNQQPSTYWQRDMSFIRLKNAEIGYTIPKKLTKKIGLSTVRIYAQGLNLLTFSEFKLWDPELDSSYGNVYPTMRTYTFGVNLNF
ncbi:MAG: SusC/RagA family TonB-linked outer membrane protein [Candidatus Cryptobacteroides sp.]